MTDLFSNPPHIATRQDIEKMMIRRVVESKLEYVTKFVSRFKEKEKQQLIGRQNSLFTVANVIEMMQQDIRKHLPSLEMSFISNEVSNIRNSSYTHVPYNDVLSGNNSVGQHFYELAEFDYNVVTQTVSKNNHLPSRVYEYYFNYSRPATDSQKAFFLTAPPLANISRLMTVLHYKRHIASDDKTKELRYFSGRVVDSGYEYQDNAKPNLVFSNGYTPMKITTGVGQEIEVPIYDLEPYPEIRTDVAVFVTQLLKHTQYTKEEMSASYKKLLTLFRLCKTEIEKVKCDTEDVSSLYTHVTSTFNVTSHIYTKEVLQLTVIINSTGISLRTENDVDLTYTYKSDLLYYKPRNDSSYDNSYEVDVECPCLYDHVNKITDQLLEAELHLLTEITEVTRITSDCFHNFKTMVRDNFRDKISSALKDFYISSDTERNLRDWDLASETIFRDTKDMKIFLEDLYKITLPLFDNFVTVGELFDYVISVLVLKNKNTD